MSKLLVTDTDDSWYDELSVIGYYYEKEFENTLLNQISHIFREYISIPFQFPFTSDKYAEYGTKLPDVLILKKDLSEWWITEVELKKHSIDHISKQVAVFSRPYFDPEILAKYIHERITQRHAALNIELAAVEQMVKLVDHRVLVIVDEPYENLKPALREYKAYLCIFQMYKDLHGRLAYRLDGDHPKVILKSSHCRAYKTYSESLEVLNADIVNEVADEAEIFIHVRGRQTRWQKFTSSKGPYLTFVGQYLYPLDDQDGWKLEIRDDEKFYLVKI